MNRSKESRDYKELVVEDGKIQDSKINPFEEEIARKGISLEVQNINVQYWGVKALNEVSFKIDAGERVGIIGNNGAGKSTLFDVISGLNKYKGKVFIDSQDVTKKSAIKRAKLGIRRVFQHPVLFSDLTVEENIIVGTPPSKGDGLLASLFVPRLFHKERIKTAKELMQYCNIENTDDVPIDNLPYATKKRIELARSLMGNPRILILDEPAASMNDQERALYVQAVNDFADTFSTTVIVIEHDLDFIKATCQRAIVLDAGELISDGPVLDVLKNEDVMSRYFGEEK